METNQKSPEATPESKLGASGESTTMDNNENAKSESAMRRFHSEQEAQDVLGKLAKIHDRQATILLKGNGHSDIEFVVPLDVEHKVGADGQIFNMTRGFEIEGFADTLGRDLINLPQILSVAVAPGNILYEETRSKWSFCLDGTMEYFFLAIRWFDQDYARKNGQCPTLKVDHKQVMYCKRAIMKTNAKYPESRGVDYYVLSMDYASSECTRNKAENLAHKRIKLFQNFFQSSRPYIPPKPAQIRGERNTPVVESPEPAKRDKLSEAEIIEKSQWLMEYKNTPPAYLTKYYRLSPILEALGGHEIKSNKPSLEEYIVEVPIGRQKTQQRTFRTNEWDYGDYLAFLIERLDSYQAQSQENDRLATALLKSVAKITEERNAGRR